MEKWYYQFALAENIRKYHCFCVNGEWWQMTVLPMGVRTACWIADTVMRLIAQLARCETNNGTPGPHDLTDVYIDNVAYVSEETQVQNFLEKFRIICRSIGATIGEVELGTMMALDAGQHDSIGRGNEQGIPNHSIARNS